MRLHTVFQSEKPGLDFGRVSAKMALHTTIYLYVV